jgi:hypothetical protein
MTTPPDLLPCPWCPKPATIETVVSLPDELGYVMSRVNIKHDCLSGFVFDYGDNSHLWFTKTEEFKKSVNDELVAAVRRNTARMWNTRALPPQPSEPTMKNVEYADGTPSREWVVGDRTDAEKALQTIDRRLLLRISLILECARDACKADCPTTKQGIEETMVEVTKALQSRCGE